MGKAFSESSPFFHGAGLCLDSLFFLAGIFTAFVDGSYLGAFCPFTAERQNWCQSEGEEDFVGNRKLALSAMQRN